MQLWKATHETNKKVINIIRQRAATLGKPMRAGISDGQTQDGKYYLGIANDLAKVLLGSYEYEKGGP